MAKANEFLAPDVDIMYRYPKLLAGKIVGITFILLEPVLAELLLCENSRQNIQGLYGIVMEAVRKGILVYEGAQEPRNVLPARRDEPSIQLLLGTLNEKYPDIKLVTEGDSMAKAVRFAGLGLIGAKGLHRKLATAEYVSLEVPVALTLQKEMSERLTGNIVIGVIGAVLGCLIVWNFKVLIEEVLIAGTILFLPLIVFGLFWIRLRFWLGAGIILWWLGLAIFFKGLFAYERLRSSESELPFILIGAGVYLMVQGLFAVDKKIRTTRMGRFWPRAGE